MINITEINKEGLTGEEYRKKMKEIYDNSKFSSPEENLSKYLDIITDKDGKIYNNVFDEFVPYLSNDFIYHAHGNEVENMDKNPLNYISAFLIEEADALKEIRGAEEKAGDFGRSEFALVNLLDTRKMTDKEILAYNIKNKEISKEYGFISYDNNPMQLAGYWLCEYGENASDMRNKVLSERDIETERHNPHGKTVGDILSNIGEADVYKKTPEAERYEELGNESLDEDDMER